MPRAEEAAKAMATLRLRYFTQSWSIHEPITAALDNDIVSKKLGRHQEYVRVFQSVRSSSVNARRLGARPLALGGDQPHVFFVLPEQLTLLLLVGLVSEVAEEDGEG